MFRFVQHGRKKADGFPLFDSTWRITIAAMKTIVILFSVVVLVVHPVYDASAQSSSPRPDVSNKALITKAGDSMMAVAALRKVADDYYAWRNENYPVQSSDAALHTWDDRLTDYSQGKIEERAKHVRAILDKVRAMKTDDWAKNDRIDWLLFR